MEKRWTSLCKVNRPDKNEDIWMVRIADLVEGTLIEPSFDDKKEKILDNRPLIYCDEGPNEPDACGFWEWTERKNEFGKWRTQATYLQYPSPIEIIVFDNYIRIRDLLNAIKTGLHIPKYVRNRFILAIRKGTTIGGVLCDLSLFNSRVSSDISISIKNGIFTLPYYEFRIDDVFSCNYRDNTNKTNPKRIYRRFYKHSDIDTPKRELALIIPEKAVCQLFVQRMSWPVFKEKGINKEDWRKVINLLVEISKGSISERLSKIYGISSDQAQGYIDGFLHNVNDYLNAKDIDSAFIFYMLDNHSELKRITEKLAYKKWIDEHDSEVKRYQKIIQESHEKVKTEELAAQQRILKIKTDINEYKATRTQIQKEIKEAQLQLEALRIEIQKHEAIGNESVAAIRQKIADAQKDVAGFISDISVFLPQYPSAPAVANETPGYRYITSEKAGDDDIEYAENWQDEINTISQNLSCSFGINSELCELLAAYFYAAFINKVPILIVGPCGKEIADVLSMSLFGCGAGHLLLGDSCSHTIVDTINNCDERIVTIENMFRAGWDNYLPQSLFGLDKQLIWTYPYAEDMIIEPKGLYNYMLPILSECFVESTSNSVPIAGKRRENFKSFSANTTAPKKISLLNTMAVSKLLMNRLTKVLSDAKAIINDTTKDKDFELLFGLLPLAVLTGKSEVLKEIVEKDNGFSRLAKNITEQYYEKD